MAIFLFGLAHCVGLSTRLQELPLPDGGALVTRIVALNIGVEIGQLAALSLMAGAVLFFKRYVGRVRVARHSAGAALALTGVVAAVALGAVAVRPNDSNAASSDGSGNCSAGPGSVSFGDEMTSGGHPAKAFFGPDEPLPGGGDLQHVMGDGRRLESPALVADGNHARADGFVSLDVVASAALAALGAEIADPLIGLLITLVILKITWDSWRTV